jgi:hypothetical protein
MQCSKQPVNLGAFGQALGPLTDYNLAPADENDLSVPRNIAPSHHGHIVKINPNGLCFDVAALHPRCHSRKLSLRGMILLPSQIAADIGPSRSRQWSSLATGRASRSWSVLRIDDKIAFAHLRPTIRSRVLVHTAFARDLGSQLRSMDKRCPACW